MPALPFRVGESIAERWGQVRGQVGEHDVDRVPVGSEFDRDLAQAQPRTRRTRGQERETGDSCPRSLSNRGEKWPSITANGFIRPPSSTPRMSWSRLLSFARPEDSNLRLWFSLGRLDSPGQLASVLPEAASDVRHGAQIAPGAPMAEFWPKYANLMNWGDPPACGIPP